MVDVSMPHGRFNLLIGANGCSKSNILEGIALAAADSEKLDYEYYERYPNCRSFVDVARF